MDNPLNDKQNRKQNKSLSILLNILFYSMLLLLIGVLIYPHTSFYYQKKIYTPLSMRLNKREIVMVKGKSDNLFVYTINKRITYSSTDFKVAQVNDNGWVYAKAVGTAVIKAKVDGSVLKCKIQVVDLNKNKLTLKVGKTNRLKIKGTWSNVRWESKNTSIAKVNRFGKVVGVQKGKTTIIGNVKGIKLSCKVTIIK